MCAVSMIFDQHRQGWPTQPGHYQWHPPTPVAIPPYNGPTKEQFDEFLELLRAAKKTDIATKTPDCGDEEKLGKVAKILTPEQLKQVREILGA